MKERGIIFTADMVKAILGGKKTMTRRVVKAKYLTLREVTGELRGEQAEQIIAFINANEKCPFGKIGSKLYVKETFCPIDDTEHGGNKWIDYKATPKRPAGWENDPKHPSALKWKSPLFMPKSASRISLEITDIKVEKVQDITEEDAKAEGVKYISVGAIAGWGLTGFTLGFKNLWNSIKGADSWDQNPFVFVISFKVIKNDK